MYAPKNIQKSNPATPRGKLHIVKQTYADGSTYEGGYLNFKKQGKGILSFANGEQFNGLWVEGLKEGSGVYTWADGSHYTGNWRSDRMNGEGVHVSSNGSKYSGSWSDNLMHGSGSYQYDNGSLYQGEWFQGQQHGSGTLIVSAKERYEGLWQMGLMHGKGTYTWENGDIYYGCYREGKKHGSGKLSLCSGEHYDGEWSLGLKHGFGIYTCSDSESYKGEWCSDRMHGEGQYLWPDGSFYQGTWVADSRSGQGNERLSDGSQYQGSFMNNTRNGLGTMLYPDGSKYEGNWLHEHWNGHGTFTSADGSALEGAFTKGVIHGYGIERDAKSEFSYEGDWKSGIREGQGVLKTPVGEYIGNFVAGKKHGQGTDSFTSGSKYTGHFIENQRHGHGVMAHSNGHIYDGHWKFGERCGQGKYVEPNGCGYVGEWEHDLKHGQGIETSDKDSFYEGQFYKGARHGQGRTTIFKSTLSSTPNNESQTAHCIHEGTYVQNKKHGVGSESYPDGSCFHGVWSDGMKHGPGLLKIANDATYHVIFNEDTIVDIFYSMEPQGQMAFSSSSAQENPKYQKNLPHHVTEVADRSILQQDDSLSVTGKIQVDALVSHQSTARLSYSVDHVRYDPFEKENSVNQVKSSAPLSSRIVNESAPVAPKGGMFPFSDFAAEDNSDIYDLNETDLLISEALTPLAAVESRLVPPQVTVIVDYGIWGGASINGPPHDSSLRTSRSKSASSDGNFAIQSLANVSLPSGLHQQSRRSHASRHHASNGKQHRVPGSTSKESVASSSGSKIVNKIDIFNL